MLESSETGEQGQLGTICVPVSDSLHQRRTLPFTISTSPFSITVTPRARAAYALAGARLYKESTGQDPAPRKMAKIIDTERTFRG